MNLEQPCVSVIVPVYKVEQYLERCVNSIRNQTYKNLEIILVDDGSPDNCGKMCDRYKEFDDRIKVIHKENGGLSSARNCALDVASGEYLCFVDSDDAIDDDMIQYLLKAIIENSCDASICGFKKIYPDKIEYVNSFNEDEIIQDDVVINTFIVDEKIGSQVCNKLYRSNLFQDVRFPIGRAYEDIAIMHEVFYKASRVICLHECKYQYFIRSDSISFSISSKWHYGLYKAFEDRYRFAISNMLDKAVCDICFSKAVYFSISGLMHWNPPQEDTEKYICEAKEFIKRNIRKIRNDKLISKKNKLRACMIVYVYPFFDIYRRKVVGEGKK